MKGALIQRSPPCRKDPSMWLQEGSLVRGEIRQEIKLKCEKRFFICPIRSTVYFCALSVMSTLSNSTPSSPNLIEAKEGRGWKKLLPLLLLRRAVLLVSPPPRTFSPRLLRDCERRREINEEGKINDSGTKGKGEGKGGGELSAGSVARSPDGMGGMEEEGV